MISHVGFISKTVFGGQRGLPAHSACAEHECRWEKKKIMFALTSIKGIGRRFANIVCKKADVDMNKRSHSPSLSVLFCVNFVFFLCSLVRFLIID